MCLSQTARQQREDRKWPGQCRRGVVAFLLVGAIALLSVRPAPSGATPASTAIAPILPGICSESDRFGLATTGGRILDYDVGKLHAGWYLNFTILQDPPRPADMTFIQMVRLSDDDGDDSRACYDCPTWDELTYVVQANPGGIWLIGNEPDSQTVQQDNIAPWRYAQLYSEIYEFIDGLDSSSLVGIGGVVQPTPLRLEYLQMILDAYKSQNSGASMPIEIWNTHNYLLRERRFLPAGQVLTRDCAAAEHAASSDRAWLSGTGNYLGRADTGQRTAAKPGAQLEVRRTAPLINELDADTPGTDAKEFVELYDGGAGHTSLDGLVLVLYDGGSDRSYFAADLDGYSTDAAGYFVLGNAGVSGVDLVFGDNLLQNGPDAAALYVGDALDFPNSTPVTVANLVDAIVYSTANPTDPDDPGLKTLLNVCQPQADESALDAAADHSSQRCPNGSAGPRNTGSYAPADPTPDAENFCSACPDCWGAGVPPGMDVGSGILYEVPDHLALEPIDACRMGWKQQIVALRHFMATNGYRDRPLVLSEYGNLMPAGFGDNQFHWDDVGDFLIATSDWLLAETDEDVGCPSDGNRLVQAWAWWPFDFTTFGGEPGEAHLFSPATGDLTPVGWLYSAYTQGLTAPHPNTVDLRVVSVQHGMPIRVGRDAWVTLTADITNRGSSPSGNFEVEFQIDGQTEPRIAVNSLLPGGTVAVQLSWEVQVGDSIRVDVSADPDELIVDCDPYNDHASARLWIGDHGTYLPMIGNASGP